MEEDHKQAMRCAITEEASNASKIDSLTDWSRMKLKTNLKYQDDFVLVSKEIWEFLVNLFGGGNLLMKPLSFTTLADIYYILTVINTFYVYRTNH